MDDLYIVGFNVKHVDVGEPPDENAVSLHGRFRCLCADLAEAQDGRSIGDDAEDASAV